jgi:hypothetical protein
MNNTWKVNKKISKSYKEMHGIEPEVSYLRSENNKYSVKLKHSGKEGIITETMKDGLTDFVILEMNGTKENLKSVYEAELKLNKFLRS